MSSQSLHSQSRSESKVPLKLSICKSCGHVQNASYEKTEEKHYGENYIVSLDHSSESQRYLKNLAEKVRGMMPEISRPQVFEIGCGMGSFLTEMDALGCDVQGIEPSGLFEFSSKKLPQKISNEPFSDKWKGKTFDLIAIRHVLEHVDQPLQILSGLQSQFLYIEVPRLEYLVENRMYADFYYDHISYFTERSLATLVLKAGFVPLRYDLSEYSEYIGLWAKKETHQRALQEFEKDWPLFKAKVLDFISSKRAQGKKVSFWGAGARGVTLYNHLEFNSEMLSGVVDSDPNKWGKFMPGLPWQVKAPEDFFANPSEVLIISSLTYAKDIFAQIQPRLSKSVEVYSLYPFERLN